MLEQAANTRRPAVLGRGPQRLPSPSFVERVDGGADVNQVVDRRQALMGGGKHERTDPRLEPRGRCQPAADVPGRRSLLETVYLGTRRD